MSVAVGKGDFIANSWVVPASGGTIVSINPATAGQPVMRAKTNTGHAQAAVTAAAEAYPAWAALSADERKSALRRFKRELSHRVESLAQAITAEMGKVIAEARTEARSLLGRIDSVIADQMPQIEPWISPSVVGECRFHPLGVIGVIGPFNYPLHLCHAHIVPALLAGNTVVMKPSERTPAAAQRYMEAWEAAGLPPVLQMVQGGGDVGRALVAAEGLNGLAFTGSWATGHAIEGALSERPEVLVALEMGGQNMAIVLEDADLDQALEGVLVGGYATAGQRCTCTSRVLVQRSVAPVFIERLVRAAKCLQFGDPSTDVFMGPMASKGDRDHFDSQLAAGLAAGAEVLLAGDRPAVGAYAGPSVHLITPDHDSAYVHDEVFGPDLAVVIVDDIDHAIEVANASPYGLSMAVFTTRRADFEHVYRHTRVGCINWNRSTNRATGAFPFGGVGRSGNYRPAGNSVIRNATFPVQVQWAEAGKLEGVRFVSEAVAQADALGSLEAVHRYEEACDPYGIYPQISDGSLTISSDQLDPVLFEALASELLVRGYASDTSDGLQLSLPSGRTSARGAAVALRDALHAIRPVHPARFIGRRPAGTHVPGDGGLVAGQMAPNLPRSSAFLERVYADELVPRDKKPAVLDLHRSTGPYMASVDADPLIFFDACSQIASQAGGLNPPAVLERLHTGGFGRTAVDTPGAGPNQSAPEFRAFAAALRKRVPTLPYVTFCNSGAEANEVALSIAAQHRPGRRAVISFEGAFHGRTFLALHSTWNPKKRLRFEFDGFQARWVPFPGGANTALQRPGKRPALDPQWRERRGAHGRQPAAAMDALERIEFQSLTAVEAALEDDQVVAVIIEPMQAEGGDRYASARFFGHLRLLTAAYEVAFIIDEVQCGFHLGGPFLWHQQFQLPEPPDIVTLAKKAQVGAAMSRLPADLGCIEAHAASAVRGHAHLELVSSAEALHFETLATPRLAALASEFGELVENPRACGYAFAFDLPSTAQMNAAIAERFWRGYLVYGAGERTLRFRLNREMDVASVDALFERVATTLRSLVDGESNALPVGMPPLHAPADTTTAAASVNDDETEAQTSEEETASDDGSPPTEAPERALSMPDEVASWPPKKASLAEGYRLFEVMPADWPSVIAAIISLQARVYEPARRDDLVAMGALLEEPGSQCLVIVRGQGPLKRGHIVASAYAYPLECFGTVDGPASDPTLGTSETLYSADVTVDPGHRGLGLGTFLKEEQVRRAMLERDTNGGPRYRYMTGRNRLGETDAMQAVNARHGAFTVATLLNQYDGEGSAAYYRIPLDAPRLRLPRLPAASATRPLCLDSGLWRRFSKPCDELDDAFTAGVFNGGLANKLSLTNFVTPAVTRAMESIRAQAPRGLGHLVLANGRAEVADKGLRAFKFHRREASVVVSVGPVYAGHSTAAARAISIPSEGTGSDSNWFGWPTVADPTLDPKLAAQQLRQTLDQIGPNKVLAVVIEGVYLNTGRAVPATFWDELKDICAEADVPIALIESTTGGYRHGQGMWLADTLPVSVDAVWYYGGGQLGMAFINERYAVKDKLTLISTWDGDEVSLQRTTLELRAARRLPITAMSHRLAAILGRLGSVDGLGLYRSVRSPQASSITQSLESCGVRVGRTSDGGMLFRPPLDFDAKDAERLEQAVDAILGGLR